MCAVLTFYFIWGTGLPCSGFGTRSPYFDKFVTVLSNHLASVQKIWRQELKGVVGLDQTGGGESLEVFVKELLNLSLAVVSDHRHVDEGRALKKVLFGLLQFDTIHDHPSHLLE